MANDFSKLNTHRDDNINITTGAQFPIKEWTVGVPVEDHARKQLFNIANMPFIHKHVAVMPDVHVGHGATVGSVIATTGAIIPAACGVDIGCGMVAVQTTLKASHLPDNLAPLRSLIEEYVPHGRTDNGGQNDEGAWTKEEPPPIVNIAWMNLESKYKKICEKHPKIFHRSAHTQLSTLGTGNHFIELCLDQAQNVWVMLHSGSRGPGNKVGTYFINLAKEEMRRWFINLPDMDLAYLPEGSQYFDDYIEAVSWCQEFARENRDLMMQQVLTAMKHSKLLPKFETLDHAVNCHHNYISNEFHFGKKVWVTRKGAVSAKKDELGIIPGCFAAGTRILMSNGTYKNIEDITIGDMIIAGDGSLTKVTGFFPKGKKMVRRYKNNSFHSYTYVTPDHLHYIGDLSSVQKSRKTIGYATSLDIKDVHGNSKYKWKRLNEIDSDFVFLTPKKINFSLPRAFSYDKLFGDHKIIIESNYDWGYVIGTFLGDGTARYSSDKGGQVTWSFGMEEITIADKLFQFLKNIGFNPSRPCNRKCQLVVVHQTYLAKIFESFGKLNNKRLPESFLCLDMSYLSGLYDGLIDSDGHLNNGTHKFTNTSKHLIETFGIIVYLLNGYFPSVSIREPSAGGLKECNLENCNFSYRSTCLNKPHLSQDFQIIKCNDMNINEIEMETYDIEVDHHEHSFIANNVIVHNSMGAKSYIVRGLGNRDSFHSCSHGAGRRMSRTEAKNTFTLKDHRAATEGVECRKDKDVIDETPGAYKDIDAVMAAQKDLVEVVYQLKQVLCVKG